MQAVSMETMPDVTPLTLIFGERLSLCFCCKPSIRRFSLTAAKLIKSRLSRLGNGEIVVSVSVNRILKLPLFDEGSSEIRVRYKLLKPRRSR